MSHSMTGGHASVMAAINLRRRREAASDTSFATPPAYFLRLRSVVFPGMPRAAFEKGVWFQLANVRESSARNVFPSMIFLSVSENGCYGRRTEATRAGNHTACAKYGVETQAAFLSLSPPLLLLRSEARWPPKL